MLEDTRQKKIINTFFELALEHPDKQPLLYQKLPAKLDSHQSHLSKTF